MTYSTITQKWQVTLPKEVRESLGIKKPGRVLLEVDKKRKAIKIKPTEDILDLAGKLKPKKVFNAVKLRALMEKTYKRF